MLATGVTRKCQIKPPPSSPCQSAVFRELACTASAKCDRARATACSRCLAACEACRPLNPRYAMDQEGLTTDSAGNLVTSSGAAPTAISLAQKQNAETDIGHIDCDTIPFMWSWAKNFVLFDNFHQTIVGPSTPNAIAIISGPSGQTQWALHNDQGIDTASTVRSSNSSMNCLALSRSPRCRTSGAAVNSVRGLWARQISARRTIPPTTSVI